MAEDDERSPGRRWGGARTAVLCAVLYLAAVLAYLLLPGYGGPAVRSMYVSFFATMTVSSLLVLVSIRSGSRPPRGSASRPRTP